MLIGITLHAAGQHEIGYIIQAIAVML